MMATDQVVAKRGDVLLELCKAGKPAGTLLVSSHVLSPASQRTRPLGGSAQTCSTTG
jgi:hypothetical protein